MFLNYKKREMVSIQQGPRFRSGQHEQFVRCTWLIDTSDGQKHTITGQGCGWDVETGVRRARAEAARLLHEALPEWGRLADKELQNRMEKARLNRDISRMIQNFDRHNQKIGNRSRPPKFDKV